MTHPFLLFAVYLVGSAHAADYFVASGGNDRAAGTATAPFATVGRATRKLAPGDTVILRGGTYVERVFIGVSGTEMAPITLRADSGTSPTIDGQRRLAADWGSMVLVKGSYVVLEGVAVKDGLGQGVVLAGAHNTVRKCEVSGHGERGILAAGDYSLVEDSRVHDNAMFNCRLSTCPATKYPDGGWATGLSAARGSGDGKTDGAILRRNVVYNNWGEGLSSFEADGTLLMGNIVYDNWAVNVYVSDSPHSTVTRNLIYDTGTRPTRRLGLALADELGKFPSVGRIIEYNVIAAPIAIGWWIDPRYRAAAIIDDIWRHNTVVGDIRFYNDATHRFIAEANAFIVPGVVRIPAGMAGRANGWSIAPSVTGPGDVIGKLGITVPRISPGAVTAEQFAPSAVTPRIALGLAADMRGRPASTIGAVSR